MGKSPGKTSSNKIIKLRQARSDPRQAKSESCLPKEQPGKGHHHDDVILLLLPESFRALLSYANYSFRYINPTGIISKFKYERKNEMNSGPSSKKTSSCKWPINFFSPDYILLSNSENREWLKKFRNADCVVTNHNEVQDM